MKSLYFVRHGQSLANTGAVSMHDVSIPLTDLGLQQAQDLRDRWIVEPSNIYCSELKRAQQTAQIFSDRYQLSSNVIKELNEFRCLDFKTVEGLQGAERGILAQKYWQDADLAHRDGEDCDSFQDFVDRIDTFLEHIPDFQDQNLFFGHGIWIGLLSWRLMGCKIENNQDMRKFRQYQTALPMFNTVVYKLSISNTGIKQLQWFNI